MKKQFILTVDVETTMDDKVADIGWTISDRQGNLVQYAGYLVRGIYNDPDNHVLFHNDKIDALWGADRLNQRYQAYENMLDTGKRTLASINAINGQLMQLKAQYDPILTAYNLAFDVSKCRNTGLNLEAFNRRFCLWSACITAYAQTRKYRQFILDNHLFTNRTDFGNMSYRTNAEVMTRYILGDYEIPDEPHTSLEDVLGYEKPLLDKLLTHKSIKWLLNHTLPYNWRNFQVKDWFKPI